MNRRRRLLLCCGLAAMTVLPVSAQAASPPDGRAFELVSRDVTNGRTVDGVFPFASVAVDDEHLLWGTYAEAFGDGRNGAGRAFLTTRTPDGWRSSPLHRPSSPGLNGGSERLVDAADDGRTTVTAVLPTYQGGASPFNPGTAYLHRSPAGAFSTIAALTPAQTDEGQSLDYGAMSADGSTVVYGSTVDPDGAPTGQPQVYRWKDGDGAAQPVGVTDADTPLSSCGSTLVKINGFPSPVRSANPNSFAADGATAFVQSPPSGSACPEPPQIYARRGDHTIRVSAPASGVAESSAPVLFAGATGDGDTVYLLSAGALTPDSVDGGAWDLYRATLEGGSRTALSCVTCGSGKTLDLSSASPVAVSPLGDHVYLQLNDGSTTGLYVYDGQQIDVVDPDVGSGIPLISPGGFEMSRDGTSVVYSRAPEPNATPQLYLARTAGNPQPAAPRCLSCGSASGVATFLTPSIVPLGTATDEQMARSASGLAGRRGSISDDGQTVVFSSTAKLTDDAAEGGTSRNNAYRWKDGSGLALVASAATSNNAPAQVSPSGRTIYLISDDPLAPDSFGVGERQWFAARIGGGFPLPPPVVGCQDDGCRTPATGPGVGPAVGSSGPAAVGNAAPKPEPSLRVTRASSAQRRSLARSGRLRLRIAVNGAGTVAVRATARIGGRTRQVGSARVTARGSSSIVRPQLRLTRDARHELARRGRLSVRVTVSLAEARTRRLTLPLVRHGGR